MQLLYKDQYGRYLHLTCNVHVHVQCILELLVHVHINVLMLCSKFELILTSIFRVMDILKNEPKSEKITVL